MKKGRWTFLIMVLALAFTAGCSTAKGSLKKTEKRGRGQAANWTEF